VVLQRRWTIQILTLACVSPIRLSQLRREIPNASKKALAATLRHLQAEGILHRRDLSHRVLHVEYELSWDKRPCVENLLAALCCLGAVVARQDVSSSTTGNDGS